MGSGFQVAKMRYRWGTESLCAQFPDDFLLISLTGRGHGDILGTLNGGGDGFTDSSHSDKESRLPLVSVGRLFAFTINLASWKPAPIASFESQETVDRESNGNWYHHWK
jgi:hypothetical protein